MTSDLRCPECGGIAVSTQEPRKIKIGRRTIVVDDKFQRCPNCHNEFYLPNQMQETQRHAAEKLRVKHNLMGPEMIRELRLRNGLTQEQLEKVLGVAPKTVVRWERGTVVPSSTANQFLRLLDRMPSLLKGLAVTTTSQSMQPAPSSPSVATVTLMAGASVTIQLNETETMQGTQEVQPRPAPQDYPPGHLQRPILADFDPTLEKAA